MWEKKKRRKRLTCVRAHRLETVPKLFFCLAFFPSQKKRKKPFVELNPGTRRGREKRIRPSSSSTFKIRERERGREKRGKKSVRLGHAKKREKEGERKKEREPKIKPTIIKMIFSLISILHIFPVSIFAINSPFFLFFSSFDHLKRCTHQFITFSWLWLPFLLLLLLLLPCCCCCLNQTFSPSPKQDPSQKEGEEAALVPRREGLAGKARFWRRRRRKKKGAPPPLFGRGFSRSHTYRRRKREEERQKFLAPTPPPPLLFFCVPNGKGKVVEVLPNFFAPQEREKGGKEGRTIFWYQKNAGTKKYENKSRTIRLMQSDKMSLPPPLTRNIYRLFCTHNTRPFIAVSDVFSISLRFFWLGKGSEGCFC